MELQNCPPIHTQDSLYSLQSLTVFVCGVAGKNKRRKHLHSLTFCLKGTRWYGLPDNSIPFGNFSRPAIKTFQQNSLLFSCLNTQQSLWLSILPEISWFLMTFKLRCFLCSQTIWKRLRVRLSDKNLYSLICSIMNISSIKTRIKASI